MVDIYSNMDAEYSLSQEGQSVRTGELELCEDKEICTLFTDDQKEHYEIIHNKIQSVSSIFPQ